MKVIAWIIGLPIAIIVVWGIGRLLFCGPDKSIQQVTDPLATAILNHINAHGKPESLADIPDLPYRVEGCEKLHSDDKNRYKEECSLAIDNQKMVIMTTFSTYNNTLRNMRVHIKNFNKNTKIYYDLRQVHINTTDKELYLSHFHIDTIQDSSLCKNGYLRMN